MFDLKISMLFLPNLILVTLQPHVTHVGVSDMNLEAVVKVHLVTKIKCLEINDSGH
jgi:hypothetical protein